MVDLAARKRCGSKAALERETTPNRQLDFHRPLIGNYRNSSDPATRRRRISRRCHDLCKAAKRALIRAHDWFGLIRRVAFRVQFGGNGVTRHAKD